MIVGIVGGGQLARMTVLAAGRLGVQVRVLATPKDESARAVWPHVEDGDPDDARVLERFSRECDVLTFDHESVDPEIVEALTVLGRAVRPGAASLRMCDKAAQRAALATLGFPVPAFTVARTVAEIEEFARANGGWPVYAKAPRGGYDGKGVRLVDGSEQAMVALALARGGGPLLVEEALPVDRELSVLLARRPGGEMVVYPVTETFQRDGVCRATAAPAAIDTSLALDAVELARSIATHIDHVGLLAVELFVVDGRIIVNELAARPHNSGHWTIDGAVTSQFENHLRAVLDLPLGDTSPRAAAVAMVNVLGPADGRDPADGLARALAVEGAHVHLYGKRPRPGRKLGHVTVLASDVATALHRASRAVDALDHRVADEDGACVA